MILFGFCLLIPKVCETLNTTPNTDSCIHKSEFLKQKMWRKILTVSVAAVAAIIGYYATLPVPEGVSASPTHLRKLTAMYDIVSLYVINNAMIAC